MNKIISSPDAANGKTTAKEMYPLIALQNNWILFKKSIIENMKTNSCEGCLLYNQFQKFSAKNISNCFIK